MIALQNAPSESELAIQRAASATMASPSFDYTAEASSGVIARKVVGAWRAPNSYQVHLEGGPNNGIIFTLIGSQTYIKLADGKAGRLRNLDINASPFSFPLDITGLPPLASLTTATDVERHGDEYSVIIPAVTLPPDHAEFVPEGEPPRPNPEALDVPATATVIDGFVVAINFPFGVRSGRDYLPPMMWRLSRFGQGRVLLVPRAT